jgi:5-methylcytosine-specific restriction endonuclease McrBC regulatory subunit McrC
VGPLLFRVINGFLDTGEDLISFKENEEGKITAMTTGQFVYFKLNAIREKLDFSKKELEEFTGTYKIDQTTSFKISRENGNLTVSVNNNPAIELIAKSKNIFYSKENNAIIQFVKKDEAEIQINGAISISKLLLLSYHSDIKRGRNEVIALMFDLNVLWEKFVYMTLKRNLKDYHV